MDRGTDSFLSLLVGLVVCGFVLLFLGMIALHALGL